MNITCATAKTQPRQINNENQKSPQNRITGEKKKKPQSAVGFGKEIVLTREWAAWGRSSER